MTVSLIGSGVTYTETFDTLAITGTSSTLPAGFVISEAGTGANLIYTAGTGSGNSGDTYSFGSTLSTDRALGELTSGSVTSTFGTSITNNSGATITSLLIAYTGEQWRSGDTAAVVDRLDFQYSLNATSLTTGTWIDVNALDVRSIITTAAAGALDGNAAANRTSLSSDVTGLSILNGTIVWIRWVAINIAGSDDGLAIDDLAITPTTAGPVGTSLSIADALVVEGNSGTTSISFTVTRAGSSAGAVTADYTVTGTTANAADFDGNAFPSGVVTFADGEASRVITLTIVGDTDIESAETFAVTLSNPTPATVTFADATAVGTITNDDFGFVQIYDIQGAGHTSSFAGQMVQTAGTVIGVDTNGFYIQSAVGDGNAATSDGLFVFTSSAPTVVVGDAVNVTGLVEEVRPGNAAANLTTTQISAPVVSILSSGNALPAATIIGTGGVLPPTDAFDSDSFTVFNPSVDAADFYESLEGSRVTILAPLVTSATNGFGETFVVASGGVGATGVNARGGITISGNEVGPDDYNPERIQLDDDSGLFAGFTPGYTQGDVLSNVTGIVSYNFQNYEVLVTQAVTISTDVGALSREVTALSGSADRVSIAAYNVENLDPTDARFAALASDIVTNLGRPDIISLEEIQDADGAGTGANLSGTVTANLLIAAIVAAGGPTYSYIEVAPTAPNTTGGEPNGNIRNGFLYNAARVDYVAGSAALVPGAAFAGSRSPLAAQFEFNDSVITAVSVHSTSRGGSSPLFGSQQPPVNGGEASRNGQAAAIRAYIDTQLATDPAALFVVLGDFNGFAYEAAIESITAGNLLTDLHNLLPESDRYSFVFDGNAQALDHILVSSSLVSTAEFDAVHLNSEQTDAVRATDHDGLVATLRILAPVVGATPSADLLTNPAGNNAINGLGGFDTLDMSAFTSAITLNTNAGTIVSSEGGNDDVTNVEAFLLGSGEDVVTLGNSGFTVRSGAGNDQIVGGTGADTLEGGAGEDVLNGGDGFDTASYAGAATGVNINLATSLYSGSDAVGDTLTSIEAIIGSGFVDTITGSAGADTIEGGAGDDILDGGDGIDTVSYANSTFGVTVHLDNPTPQDTVQQGVDKISGFENILGSAQADSLWGDDFDNRINGGAGFDLIVSGGGNNVLIGGSGGDIYILQGVNDVVTEAVGGGFDIILAQNDFTLSAGSEVEALAVSNAIGIALTGNEFQQTLTGREGDDTLNGGGGNDLIISGLGTNILIGGTGDDIYYAQGANDVVTEGAGGGFDVVLAGGDLTLSATSEVEVIAVNTASGVTITGSNTNQVIQGAGGNDRLIGGGGNDTLTGSAGSDTFVLLNTFSDRDFITDFATGVDRLEISAALFGGGLAAGPLSADQLLSGAGAVAATTAEQRFIYDSSTGNLLFDADGNGAGASILFSTLLSDGIIPVFPTLTVADFLIAV